MTERRSRHGLYVLKVAVKVRGLSAIDKRTAAGQALIAWRQELLSDLGGEDCVSAQRRALVDMAVRTRLYVDHVDAWLMEQRSLLNKRKKAILPVLRERQSLVDSLARLLGQLGLERVAKPVPSLQDYLARKERESASPEPPESSREPSDDEPEPDEIERDNEPPEMHEEAEDEERRA